MEQKAFVARDFSPVRIADNSLFSHNVTWSQKQQSFHLVGDDCCVLGVSALLHRTAGTSTASHGGLCEESDLFARSYLRIDD